MWPDLGGGCCELRGWWSFAYGASINGDFSERRNREEGIERGFYCPRTRVSCWNSKGSFRRDITLNVRVDPPGSIKGGGTSDNGGGLMISLCACKR